MYPTGPSGLIARCNVLKRRLRREYALRPPVSMKDPCRWRKIGVAQVCKQLAKRYNVSYWAVCAMCHPQYD